MSHHGSDPLMDEKNNEIINRVLGLPNIQAQDKIKLGATGKFPEGKLNENDEGEIALGIAADKDNKKIIMNFGKPTAWIGFNVEQALNIANTLIKKASEIAVDEKPKV